MPWYFQLEGHYKSYAIRVGLLDLLGSGSTCSETMQKSHRGFYLVPYSSLRLREVIEVGACSLQLEGRRDAGRDGIYSGYNLSGSRCESYTIITGQRA